jgi:predicted HAD superfamily Cof-like phosphohydrolase
MADFTDIINKVKEFHTVFELGHQNSPVANPGNKTIELRHRLMEEENNEYLEAANDDDLELVADALGDKLYILCGTIIAHGMQHKIVEVFEEIHRSNMSKLGADGKPVRRDDGKILKGPKYFLPDIQTVLDNKI